MIMIPEHIRSIPVHPMTPGDNSWHFISSAIVYVCPTTLQEVFTIFTLKSMKTCWYMFQKMGKSCAYQLELKQNPILTQLHQKRNSTATHSELNIHTWFWRISYGLGPTKYFIIFRLYQHIEIKNMGVFWCYEDTSIQQKSVCKIYKKNLMQWKQFSLIQMINIFLMK